MALGLAMQKKPTIAMKDTPGFIVNRLLMPPVNEAIQALHEGIATKQDIDESMKLCTGWPMGPLAVADLIGLDYKVSCL